MKLRVQNSLGLPDFQRDDGLLIGVRDYLCGQLRCIVWKSDQEETVDGAT